MRIFTPEWLSVDEAAEKAGLDPSMIRRYCRQERIRARRYMGRWFVSSKGLKNFMKIPRHPGNQGTLENQMKALKSALHKP